MKSSHIKMIDQYFEGTLPREQWKEFSTQLSQSSELRREFRKRAVLDEYLYSNNQNFDISSISGKKRSKFSAPRLILFAACIVVGFMIFNQVPHFVEKVKKQNLPQSALKSATPIAKLIDYHDANVLGYPRDPRKIKFTQGRYDVVGGSLHLRLEDCVDFLFSGPGSFEIAAPKLIKVSEGNIRVIVLNKEGLEFTIHTPTNQYIDWGTEFCLNVPPKGRDIINVQEGEVEVQSHQYPGGSEILNRFTKEYPNSMNQLVSIDKGLNSITPGGMGRLRNIQHIKECSTQPDVIGVYDLEYHYFNSDINRSRIPKMWKAHADRMSPNRYVFNLHKTSKECSHGIFHGSNRTSGRWHNSLALNLFQDDSHLSIDLEKDYQNFSLSFWFMQNGRLKNPLNSLVRPYRWKGFGNLSVEITRSGKIKQYLWGETNLSTTIHNDSSIKEGWNHLVYTFGKDGGNSSSRIYLNSNLVNEAIPRWTKNISLRNMIIGSSKSPEGDYLNGFRSILDELIIWKKTLNESEIKEHYLNGLPLYDLQDQVIQILANNQR